MSDPLIKNLSRVLSDAGTDLEYGVGLSGCTRDQP